MYRNGSSYAIRNQVLIWDYVESFCYLFYQGNIHNPKDCKVAIQITPQLFAQDILHWRCFWLTLALFVFVGSFVFLFTFPCFIFFTQLLESLVLVPTSVLQVFVELSQNILQLCEHWLTQTYCLVFILHFVILQQKFFFYESQNRFMLRHILVECKT